MIISHSNKFIYIKSSKTASSSIEATLWKSCSTEDIRTPMAIKPKGKEYFLGQNSPKDKFIRNHSRPKIIKEYIGEKIWNSYHKIVGIRNPWDTVVSLFWFQNRQDIKIYNSFKSWDKSSPFQEFLDWFYNRYTRIFPYINDQFIYWPDGTPTSDSYIRFENIEQDYKELCKKLKIKSFCLERHKSSHRPKEVHYSVYYNNDIAEKIYQKTIWEQKNFGYTFEDKRKNHS